LNLEREESVEFHLDKAKVLPKANVYEFLREIKRFGALIAPKKKGNRFVFDKVENVAEVELHYTRTVLPPKKFLLPYRRERFTYDLENLEFRENSFTEERIIFGIHPCDLHGISILDAVYLKENPDPKYLEVRKRTVLIGISCKPDDFCFCLSTGTAFPDGANWDLFLTDIGSDYFLTIGSPRGDEIVISLRKYLREITKEDLNLYKQVSSRKRTLFKTPPDLSRISQVIELEYDSPVWEEEGKRCLGCGTCTNVCPTCFCYTSVDVPDIEGSKVSRIEFTTSCQYPYYSLVAGGHYFKPKRSDRFKHRYYHKFVGYPYQVGKFGCVGCGRCSAECPAGISMVETLKKLKGEIDEERAGEVANEALAKRPL